MFYADPKEHTNKTALAIFADLASEIQSVLVDRISKGECPALRFARQQKFDPTLKPNAEIYHIEEILSAVKFDKDTGIAIFTAYVRRTDMPNPAKLKAELETVLLDQHLFLDGYTPSRQFHRCCAVLRLIDRHR